MKPEIPADLSALTVQEFADLRTAVTAYATELLADEGAAAADLIEASEMHTAVTAEDTRRTELETAATAARASLAAATTPAAPTEPAPEPVPAPVPAPQPEPTPAPAAVTAAQGTVAQVPASTIETPAATRERYARMVGGSDARGGELETFADAVNLISDRLSTYSSSTRSNPGAKQIGGSRYAIGGKTMTRHQNVAFKRDYPAELTIGNTLSQQDAVNVLEFASNERNLPGGSLRAAVDAKVKAGKSLTAAVGWCAPSETIYDLCELESMDGMLDIPEVQAARGGFIYPENGGPDFSVIYDSIGDDGDVILTEYDVENGVEKVCVEVPCPEFIETRLDVAYICITGNLLQQRGYPEAVARFTRGAMVALAHKVNASVLARMEAGSGGLNTITADPSGDDAVSSLLSGIELAIEDMKYRHRMSRATTMEVVLPFWVMVPMRAAMARRRGVAAINVSDAEILSWFSTRGAVPRFVYDWQDAFAGQANSPGGASPLLTMPANVRFMVYPAGTWVKPVRDVVNLDTVYDNALLTRNQFTAIFAEDGFNVLKMCVDSRVYQVAVDPSGVTGCCP
jgi:hypothetical protein